RCSSQFEQVLQGSHHFLGCETSLHLNRQAFSRVFVHDGQQSKQPPVGSLILHKVIAPNCVDFPSPSPPATVPAMTQSSLFSLFSRYSQPFRAPEPMHAFSIHPPAFVSQQHSDPSIAESRTLQ